MLAGSGHIAGVVNPPCEAEISVSGPAAARPATFEDWVAEGQETPGLLVDRLGAMGTRQAPEKVAGTRAGRRQAQTALRRAGRVCKGAGLRRAGGPCRVDKVVLHRAGA